MQARGLKSHLRNPRFKKAGIVSHVPVIPGWGGEDAQIPGAPLRASLAYSAGSGLMGGCLQDQCGQLVRNNARG